MSLLQNFLKIKYCILDKDEDLLEYFKQLTSSLNIRNIFNPSFYCDDDVKIFAFRALPNCNDWLFSFASIEDKIEQSVKNISLDLYEEFNGIRLIDPKVTKIKDEFYITFNSGGVPGENDIFIMKIYPKMESPKRVIYKNRQKEERNWAFFSAQGEIYALYRINPLKILKVKNISDKEWEMEDFYYGEKDDVLLKDLTIGTQLFNSDGKYYFVAHKKFYFLRKKIYVGKLCVLDFNKKKIRSGKYWLVHSLKSLLGSKVKHNLNLFSCTYFSGIQVSSDSIKLGYGVNDVSYGFSSHTFGVL
jgi:hypothetical protein